jgi:hypothetical protein
MLEYQRATIVGNLPSRLEAASIVHHTPTLDLPERGGGCAVGKQEGQSKMLWDGTKGPAIPFI